MKKRVRAISIDIISTPVNPKIPDAIARIKNTMTNSIIDFSSIS